MLWTRVKSKLWGKKFWSGGYFAETVGRVTSETVRYYVERQQGKHWKNEYEIFLMQEDMGIPEGNSHKLRILRIRNYQRMSSN